MEIHNIAKLEGAIMYGIVNEKLRLECDSLEDLMAQCDINADELQNRLDEMGCFYDPVSNQLRQK